MLIRSANLGLLCVVASACVGTPTPPGALDSSGGDSSSTSVPSANSDASTGTDSSTGVADGTSSSGTTDADESTSTTSPPGDESSSSGSTGSEGEPVDVPFTLLDTSDIPMPVRVVAGWHVFTSAAEWEAHAGIPAPAGVDFGTQWLLYGSRGTEPFPGHALQVTTLTHSSNDLRIDGFDVDPGADCDLFRFVWPVDTLLAMDHVDGPNPTLIDQVAVQMLSCAGGAGASMDCAEHNLCAPGLLCGGLIRSTVFGFGDAGGLCLPETNAGVFFGEEEPIPTNGVVLEAPLQVTGLATVDMDVAIWLGIDHPAPEELVVELRNPSGNQVPVLNHDTPPFHPGGVGIVPTGFSADESVNGTWWLVVQDDVVNGNNGMITSWELEIMSRLD